MLCGRWECFLREFAQCRRCRKANHCGKECQSTAWSEGHRFWCSAKDPEEDGEHHHHHHQNGESSRSAANGTGAGAAASANAGASRAERREARERDRQARAVAAEARLAQEATVRGQGQGQVSRQEAWPEDRTGPYRCCLSAPDDTLRVQTNTLPVLDEEADLSSYNTICPF